MKEIKTTDAIGHTLCHDITQIIKGVKKGVAFKKGHIVQEEDIPVLLSLGKEHLYVWEQNDNMLHENDAADMLYALCAGEHMYPSDKHEGKVEVFSDCDGFFRVDIERLRQVNLLGEMMIATRRTNSPIKKGDVLAATRIIPLMIEKDKMNVIQEMAKEAPLLKVQPYVHKKVAIIATGSEIYKERIKDTFTPTILDKVKMYDTEVIETRIQDDNPEAITKDIKDCIALGADVIFCTGGMSVDPDDKTPLAIRNSGVDMISYGAHVLPGSMFLLSYINNTAVIGLPGCVMYNQETIFDIIMPRIFADIRVSREDIAALGHGGLCLKCPTCIYPNCAFGSGV